MDFTKTLYKNLSSSDQTQHTFLWEIVDVRPFNEAIISWNGLRPETGKWTIQVSLYRNGWSSWLYYAEWSSSGQKTFKCEDEFARTYQDAAMPKEGLCTGIRIQAAAEEGADLREMRSLYACLSNLNGYFSLPILNLKPVRLKNVPSQSQIVLDHPRSRHMCSPTSTSNAINYLLNKNVVDAVDFASRSRDEEFDIHGNWILNTAEAYQRLEGKYRVYVSRVNGFHDLHAQLEKGFPVVVSVKGSIPGAPQPYNEGHLICATGYEPGKIHVVDPAFPDNESTSRAYAIDDFLEAWGKRKNLCYLFRSWRHSR